MLISLARNSLAFEMERQEMFVVGPMGDGPFRPFRRGDCFNFEGREFANNFQHSGGHFAKQFLGPGFGKVKTFY